MIILTSTISRTRLLSFPVVFFFFQNATRAMLYGDCSVP
jgi:hypothetical protein